MVNSGIRGAGASDDHVCEGVIGHLVFGFDRSPQVCTAMSPCPFAVAILSQFIDVQGQEMQRLPDQISVLSSGRQPMQLGITDCDSNT